MTGRSTVGFDAHRQRARLTRADLFLRYFELGGMSDEVVLEAICCGALIPDDHDHDLIAVALNERFAELGKNDRVPYAIHD